MKKMTALQRVQRFFKTHDWTTGAYARNYNGIGVSPRSKKAVSFCIYGAARHMRINEETLRQEVITLGFPNPSLANDCHASKESFVMWLDGLVEKQQNEAP